MRKQNTANICNLPLSAQMFAVLQFSLFFCIILEKQNTANIYNAPFFDSDVCSASVFALLCSIWKTKHCKHLEHAIFWLRCLQCFNFCFFVAIKHCKHLQGATFGSDIWHFLVFGLLFAEFNVTTTKFQCQPNLIKICRMLPTKGVLQPALCHASATRESP